MEFKNNKQLSILTLTKINIPLRFSPIKSTPSLKEHTIQLAGYYFSDLKNTVTVLEKPK